MRIRDAVPEDAPAACEVGTGEPAMHPSEYRNGSSLLPVRRLY
jgi:hypothetical protein